MVRDCVVAGWCLVLVFTVKAGCEESWVSRNDSTSRSSGKLSQGCIMKYYHTFIRREVPQRTYRYFHEEKELDNNDHEEGAVDLRWRIVGGRQEDIEQAPYAVLYGLFCGGSLIAPDWVITAAHCKSNDDFVIAGSTKSSEGTRYHICSHFIHPLWNDPQKAHFHDYDYQLVLLESRIPVTARCRPIAIGRPGDVVPGETLTVSGWGHTQMKQKQMQNLLRQVSVPIMSPEECKSLPHKYYKSITPRMFCAGLPEGTKDSCQGDSGGPAVVNNRLVGLVSFGIGCAEKERPGVYINVPLARGWIREVTGLPL